MFTRQSQLDHYGAYDLPVVNVTAECRCRDFVTPAKARGWPPFALLLYGIARATLEVENFRFRIVDGAATRLERLTVGYTVIGVGDNLNFSSFPFDPEWPVFLERYLTDRDIARNAQELRAAPLESRDYIFVTCLPWLRFSSIQHPIGNLADTSIPSIAVGRFDLADGQVRFPMSVQAHHGLVDGLHIQRLFAQVEAGMAELVAGFRP
jgi:chloramphenicol O-acetyltransferase type A